MRRLSVEKKPCTAYRYREALVVRILIEQITLNDSSPNVCSLQIRGLPMSFVLTSYFRYIFRLVLSQTCPHIFERIICWKTVYCLFVFVRNLVYEDRYCGVRFSGSSCQSTYSILDIRWVYFQTFLLQSKRSSVLVLILSFLFNEFTFSRVSIYWRSSYLLIHCICIISYPCRRESVVSVLVSSWFLPLQFG